MMTESGQTETSNRLAKRLWLITALGLTATVGLSGCQSLGSKTAGSQDLERYDTVQEVAPVSPAPADDGTDPAVLPAGFTDELEQISPSDLSGTAVRQPFSLEPVRLASRPNNTVTDQPDVTDGLTLEGIESIALANNPTIQQLVATTQKAAGFRTQVGLRANPTIGYQGQQLADEGTDQHSLFISQTIITADKRELNRRVLNEALRAQLLELDAQKYRVSTDIRVKFYDALAAQRRMQVIHDFQSVADQGLEIAQLRKDASEGSQLEVVQAKVQKNEIDLALQQAEVNYHAAWRELAALAGSPEMIPVALVGQLPDSAESQDWSALASTMIVSSPEYQAAQTRVSQANAILARHNVQAVPNLELQLSAGNDNGTNSGFMNVQVGAPIPVFNKNQGNIAAARGEQMRACKEVQRIENSIKSRLAVVSRQYDASLAAVNQYANNILPNADQGLKLAEIAYKAGETSFVQVLVARRTYFDTNLKYIQSQSQLAQARARVDGFVLTGALNPVIDESGDDSLRGLTFSQQ
ncbi:TolC family protein [Stieleria sp. TO1_6]|uniref:TolC family protein n=1 Tax=Stieleria tagensis TaxID=2956795 RepID=UPI00209A701D|nr:TolC family protein [Stieleria tagensis]MCO8124767.1 TolC family protein [Stieleria tagensis]